MQRNILEKNDRVYIVGILFPVPQIMIHQLLGILFLTGFLKIIFPSKYYGCTELNFLRKPAKTCWILGNFQIKISSGLMEGQGD